MSLEKLPQNDLAARKMTQFLGVLTDTEMA